MMDRKKALELDKICRLCISERKEMRPLFSEKVPDMLMDITNVHVEPTEGWPDKICVQCVHAVSRNHAFKTLVERSDKELREYINGLTVRLVAEEQTAAAKQQAQERKQQKQLQKQQRLLEEQMQQQQQKQQRLLEEEMQHQQQQQQILQQQHQQQPPPAAKPKLKPLLRKGSRQHKQRHLEAAPAPQPAQPPPPQQQQVQLLPEPAPQQQQPQTLHQQIQQLQLPTLQPAPTQLLSTAAATTTVPQQILLPNGQFITTAQIVAPQLAQIISTAPQATANGAATAAQSQFLPQLLQTPGGQTLQIVQQPNGTQTLQLVQLVPQRTLAPTGVSAVTTTTTTSATDMGHGHHGGVTLADADVQLLDDGCEVEDEDLDEVYEQLDSKGDHSFETIVLDDDQQQDFLKDHQQHQQQHQHHHHQVLIDEDLTQSESQEHEYFDDLEDHQEAMDDVDGDMEEQLKQEEEEEDTFIIEEIQLEDDEMLEDPDAEAISPSDCEYITDDHDPHLSGEVDDVDDADLQYAIMEPPDGETSAEIDQAFLEHEQVQAHHQQQEELQSISLENAVVEFSQATADAMVPPTLSVSSPSPTPKRAKRSHQAATAAAGAPTGVTLEPCDHQPPTTGHPAISSKLAAANSRQLVQTASVIAAAGADDNFEIDANLVTEFIRQHTSPLGSGRYVCHLCSTEFRQFKGLQNHMHSHTNWIRANCKKQPQCEICLKSFKGPGMLRMHMKTHDAESSTPVCTICNRTFKSKAILYRHRQTHQQRAYCCGVANCRKNFSSAANLKWHVERKHPEVVEPLFKCGECGSLYESVDALQMHVETTDHTADMQVVGAGQPDDDAFSGAVSIVSNGNDMASLMTGQGGTTLTGATGSTGDTHAVVVGSSGEVYFVTQA